MDERKYFFKVLHDLAQSSKHELNETVVGMYEDELKPFGFRLAAEALKEIYKKHFRMPTISEVTALLNPQENVRERATLLATRMIAAIGIKGRYWTSKIGGYEPYPDWESACKAYFEEDGELALQVIRLSGGWTRFHEEHGTLDGNNGNEKARLRDVIQAQLTKIKSKHFTNSIQKDNTSQHPILLREVIKNMALEDKKPEQIDYPIAEEAHVLTIKKGT